MKKEKSGAITIEEQRELREAEKSFVKSIVSAPGNKKKIRIDDRTWIYISEERCPLEARRRFKENYGY